MVLDALEVLIVYGIKKDGIMNRKYKQKFLFLDLESYVAIYFCTSGDLILFLVLF